MEDVQQGQSTRYGGISIGKAFRLLQKDYEKLEAKLGVQKKDFKFPGSWMRRLKPNHRKDANDVLVLYFNKKNEIEIPQWMRVIGGDTIIHRNKSHLFDPKYTWHFKVRGLTPVYCVREIDAMPIMNDDYEELKKEGRSTDWNEILLKQLLEAKTAQGIKAKTNWVVGIIIGIIVIGGLIWFFASG